MRKLTVLFLLGVFCLYSLSFADTGQPEKAIEKVINEIRAEQGTQKREAINPDNVSENRLEELGEAVMELMHPNQRQHEYMDRLMGGEGSESLKSMHRWMGYNYLSGDVAMMPCMMGRDMMGSWSKDKTGKRRYFPMYNMMDYGYHMGYGGMFMWIIFLVVIGLVVYFAARSAKGSPQGKSGETALEILKKRYAKGEITKEEYDSMKKDLIG